MLLTLLDFHGGSRQREWDLSSHTSRFAQCFFYDFVLAVGGSGRHPSPLPRHSKFFATASILCYSETPNPCLNVYRVFMYS